MSQHSPRFNRAFLALGSNIDPERNLVRAVELLGHTGTVRAVSSIWETIPVGYADQPHFLNAALLLETELSAEMLVHGTIRDIELALKRVRDPENPNGPRTIDLDLALFNTEILQIDHRHIPDPDILKRNFLAIPLAELAPDYVHPETGQTLREIADGFNRQGMKKRETDQLPASVIPE